MAATYAYAELDDNWGNSHGYGPCEAPQASQQGCSLLGWRHVACGHVDPGMHLANEFAERYLTGRFPMGAGGSCVVSATHMSHRTPDSKPCEPKYSNTNPMASQVVVGC
eukprot:7843104-Pyramimonas_sp.AAC.1